jgi:hypothetical protein
MLLAAASRILPRERWRAFLVTPQTLLRWHRELIRRKVDASRPQSGQTAAQSRDGRAHRADGQRKLQIGLRAYPGELLKLGIRVSATSIRTVLRREGLGPAPRRAGHSWSEFLQAKLAGSWPSTSLLWRQSGFARCMSLRSRARVQTRAPPRRDQEPRFGVGDPAGSERGGRGAASRRWVPDPRPRFEVLRSIRPRSSGLRASASSALRSGLRRPTHWPSGG